MSERYPIVTDIASSQNTANILKNLLFSQCGVLTGHLTYMYQSWMWGPNDVVLSDYFGKLAENDGEVLNALGNIAVAFSGDPNFMTVSGRNWDSSSLIKQTDREKLLQESVKMEKGALQDFENAILSVENESLKRLLSSIVEDKEKIIADLTNLQEI
ncbi:MAG: hypothetical protein J6K39_04040 [Clostridia bacterium]|nr:hypothetical protein [Clostridia bacterium]